MPKPELDIEEEEHFADEEGLSLEEWRAKWEGRWATYDSKEEQRKLLQEKESQIYSLIRECVELADEHGLKFEIPHNRYISQGAIDLGIGDDWPEQMYTEWSGWQKSYC